MARYFLVLFAFFVFGCDNTDVGLMTGAAMDAVKAVTLTTSQVRAISRQAALESDARSQTAPAGSAYDARLRRLVAGRASRDGHDFNFKAYLTDVPNAFAMADGSIRINSGLMDIMTDEELLFILGHEMGHVVNNHSRKKLIMALSTSALRKGLASRDDEVGQIAASMIGGFAQQLANAQFSQHEERQADSYGVAFLKEAGLETTAAVTSLRKLADLAGQHTFLSSHPHPEARAKRLLKAKSTPNQEIAGEEAEEANTLTDKAKAVLVAVYDLIVSIVQRFG